MLINKINEDFKVAYKNKQMEVKDFLGFLKSELTKKNKEPNDTEVITIIKSLLKINNISLEKTGISSLKDIELNILNSYLPQELTKEDIINKIDNLIENNLKTMPFIIKQFKDDNVDMKLVVSLINEKLKSL